MKKSILFIFYFILFLSGNKVDAQYYDWGQDPASVKWRKITTRDIKYVFPENYERNTVRIMHYLDTIRPQIGYGFRHGPMKRMPLVIHSQNFMANGLVMLAPKRIELIVTPDANHFAFPTLKQLAIHEYRHAVQYNNLNRGLIKGLSYILGQQGSVIGLAFMPVWSMEGDAVLAETQMSTFGRGVQPTFSIEYRAMALEGKREYAIDKFFSGSYKHYMPDHYKLGYQIMSWADDHYGENVLDKTSRYGSRNPYLIFPFSIALKKYYKTTEGGLFRDSFDSIFEYWRSLPLENNTAQIIETPITSYTTYSYPKTINDTLVVALKSDLDRTSRLVGIDPRTGQERTLIRTGYVNSHLVVANGKVYWTEYRSSTFWEQRVHSQLCYYDLATGEGGTDKTKRNILFPVPMLNGEIAGIYYSPDGTYRISYHDGKHNVDWDFMDDITIHGLTYDRVTNAFYFIGLGDDGMFIGAFDAEDKTIREITKPGYTSISNLTSEEGILYFTSIASGKDEAHMYDLAENKEYRITTSRYGSFSPSAAQDGVILTTYTPDGYMLSHQDIDPALLEEVPYLKVPHNRVNPERRKWPVINMDEVTVRDTTPRRVKKYRKGLNMFNIHSWAPVSFEPDRIMSEANFNIKTGATLMSQNNLNSVYSQLNYGWTGTHSIVSGKLNYSGWAPKFEIDALWSNRDQIIMGMIDGARVPQTRWSHIEITARGYMPFLLSSGANFRTLIPSIDFQYTNAKLFQPEKRAYDTGVGKLTLGLQYTENQRMAHRDFLPRFGYGLRVNYTMNPMNDNFGKLWSVFGRIYLPGLAPHHSLMIRGAGQSQKTKRYIYRQKELFPRGADFDNVIAQKYVSGSVDYQLPLCYPDGGINSILYFRRIRLNFGGDYARYKDFGRQFTPPQWHNVWSYGGDIIFDIVPLRLPSNTNTTFTITIRKPSDNRGVVVGVSMSLPI